MKDDSKKQIEETINPSDFSKVSPVQKIGHIYPDLYSQASYLIKDVENIKSEIVEIVNDINQTAGNANVKFIIDSIYHFIESEIETSKDFDDYFDDDNLKRLSSDVYARVKLAEQILDLISLSDNLKYVTRNMELTKQHLLL